MSRSKAPEESAPGVPIWIITFSDMTTNLLTFFVLLLSMGHVRDDSLFDRGPGNGTVVPGIRQGRLRVRKQVDFEHPKTKYTVDQPERPEGITKNAREERREGSSRPCASPWRPRPRN